MEVPFRLVDVFTRDAVRGQPAVRGAEPPAGLDGDDDADPGARDRVLRDDVRDRDPGRRLRRADLHARRGARRSPDIRRSARRSRWCRGPAWRPRLIQTSTAGDVPVEVDLPTDQAWMRQLPPVVRPEVADRDAVASAAGLEPPISSRGCPVVSGFDRPGASDGAGARRSDAAPGATGRRGMPARSARPRGRIPLPVRGPWRRRRHGAHVRPGDHDRGGPGDRLGARVRWAPTSRSTDSRACRGSVDVAQGEMVRPTELPSRRGRTRRRLVGDLGGRRRADRGRRRVRGLSVRPRDRTSGTARRSPSTVRGRPGRTAGRSRRAGPRPGSRTRPRHSRRSPWNRSRE